MGDMNIHAQMVQGSAEWFAARCGCATGSRISDLRARIKTGWGASRANYAAQLVAERLTGAPAESYSNAAMQWGVEMEPQARTAYEDHIGGSVDQVGFIPHPKIARAGASPDGLVGTAGLVEIKCPNTATHIETLLGSSAPKKYTDQIQFQLACTGRQWCDFVSFDPRLPDPIRLFTARIERDDALIAEIEKDVAEFLAEVERTVAALADKYLQF